MSLASRPKPVPWLAFCFSLAGLLWCGYIAFPTASPVPCLSYGCALFSDSRIAGISLWWVGGACFFVLSVLCLRGQRLFAWWLARVALWIDCGLLLFMAVSAPCFNCLVAALFFMLCFLSLRPAPSGWGEAPAPRAIFLIPLWLGLFLGNAAMVASDALPPWALGNKQSALVRIYFSPSCPACREALLTQAKGAALHPVVEKAGDKEAILRLEVLLAANVPMEEALLRCQNPDEPVPALSIAGQAYVSFQLLRNKVTVLRQGFTALPLVQVNGVLRKPVAASTPAANSSHAKEQSQAGDLPWDEKDLVQCKQNADKPCDDPL